MNPDLVIWQKDISVNRKTPLIEESFFVLALLNDGMDHHETPRCISSTQQHSNLNQSPIMAEPVSAISHY